MPNELYIYKIECSKNGKKYIGRTSNIVARKQHHFYDLRHGIHKVEDLQDDFNKYGEDAFTFELLETYRKSKSEKKELENSSKERKWMCFYRSYIRELGYNYKDQMFQHFSPEFLRFDLRHDDTSGKDGDMPRVRLDQDYWKYVFRDELRKHKQKDIAKVLGCSQQTVSNKIKNVSFTLPEMAKLKRELGIDIERVVDSF